MNCHVARVLGERIAGCQWTDDFDVNGVYATCPVFFFEQSRNFGVVKHFMFISFDRVRDAFVWTDRQVAMNCRRLAEGAFTKVGADPLNLTVRVRKTGSLVADIGGRTGWMTSLGSETLVSDLEAKFNYDFDIDDHLLSAGFTGYRGATFTIYGREPERYGLVIGGGLSFLSGSGFRSSLRVQEELREGCRSFAVYGGLRLDS
ncbi:hypothetical protein EDC39_11044 [Geothermobacter ehrlichii]|uniref:Autotransporter domain-containing protein n=1 Tax=Geothermobacter ehrlichii TaxID=213224 RepID=A0A5D3WGE1_9BACT|nr:autotransporter outer membrane beta-barrel domain-containing protein [Geothermobacter ehrlichii]TYO97504.1 hypothetical protein EDC39_11044 [Geothermobacter ehrlichii]